MGGLIRDPQGGAFACAPRGNSRLEPAPAPGGPGLPSHPSGRPTRFGLRNPHCSRPGCYGDMLSRWAAFGYLHLPA